LTYAVITGGRTLFRYGASMWSQFGIMV